MLVNFCDTCLRTEVTCSTVSTEGYEVSNLVNNSGKGFLAYSCIKPPVSIDFVFICNIQISHVVVWPQIGAQKSCGFQLSVKSADTNSQPFTNVSTVFLKKEESGVFFYRRDISNHIEISAPPNFVQQCIKAFNITNYASTLRVSILKTDNSVPALAKIEIWGKVSPKCSKDMAMNVMALWMNRFNNSSEASSSVSAANSSKKEEEREQVHNDLLNVPEDFLDPITCEIMTQPVILPSGKIIDQKTLEKHAHNEGIWGRTASDPFTGICFSDNRKPVAALPLKARIDKFLLENSHEEEIKNLPRVLGTKSMQSCKTVEVIITCVNSVNATKSTASQVKRKLPGGKTYPNTVKKSFHGHSLPLVSMRSSGASKNSLVSKTQNSSTAISRSVNKEEIERRNAAIEEKLISNIRIINTPTCKCCTDNIFYKLPCKHVICRKALLSLEKNQCTICKSEFKTSDPQRFHFN